MSSKLFQSAVTITCPSEFDRGYSTGRLVAVTYGSGSSAGTYRGYDQMGRVVRQYQHTDSVNYLVEATYNANSSLHDQTYPSVPGAGDRRLVSYTNDAAGRLNALSSLATSYAPAASVSNIGYAAHNALNTETYGNGLIHAIDYNNRLQLTQIKLGVSGNPTSVVSLGYSYGTTNNNGNVQYHTYSGGGLSYTQTFGFDSLNRLTASSENGSNWSQTNAYDRYGNRWIDLGGGNQSLYFNTANNQITGLSYDAAGNLLNDGTHSYTDDAENKIAKVDGVTAYIYDGEGQRVRKLLQENLRFVYSIGGQLIAEFSGSTGSLLKEYIYGADGLLATIEPTAVNANGTRYTTSGHLGSPRVVTNSGGGPVSRHDYMPFGEELNAGIGGRTTGMGFPGTSDGLRQKFTQKERDIETGLDYFLARYYSSTQGRFTSPDEFKGGPEELFGEVDPHDPLFYADTAEPQSLNKYHYCLNNPLRYVDTDGHQTTVADRIRNAAATVREAAATVARAAEPVINGASSALAEDNGLSPNPGPQSSVGRAIGHGIALAQSVAEIAVGVSAAAGGGAEAVATSPAVVTVVGAAAPVAGVVVAVGGVVTAGHGALVGANTINNIFNKNTSGQSSGSNQQPKAEPPKRDRSLEGTQVQHDNIKHAQKVHRNAGRPERIRSTKKSDQNIDNALRKIQSSKDVEN